MIRFHKTGSFLILEYAPHNGPEWIDIKLKDSGEVTILKTFYFSKNDLVESKELGYARFFSIGKLVDSYYLIRKNILNIGFDLLLSEELEIHENTFISPDRISIFKKIDDLISEPIIIGGEIENAIPIQDFEKLLSSFPTKTTLNHFANSRISVILKDYFSTITDSEKQLQDHLNRKRPFKAIEGTPILSKRLESRIYEYEIEKYTYIKNSLEEMLQSSESYSESEWQNLIVNFLLLIFPKYISVLEQVCIKDYYSNPGESTNRFIDLLLVDSNGNTDIIEIKKPFERCLVSTNQYRNNFTPKKELSGTVMQVEKYIFHLSKWGREGEKVLNRRMEHQLPDGISIKITNPKALIIIGRDNCLNDDQKFDFEIIRRKYSNVMDIITYDDLLRRFDNTINKFNEMCPATTIITSDDN